MGLLRLVWFSGHLGALAQRWYLGQQGHPASQRYRAARGEGADQTLAPQDVNTRSLDILTGSLLLRGCQGCAVRLDVRNRANECQMVSVPYCEARPTCNVFYTLMALHRVSEYKL